MKQEIKIKESLQLLNWMIFLYYEDMTRKIQSDWRKIINVDKIRKWAHFNFFTFTFSAHFYEYSLKEDSWYAYFQLIFNNINLDTNNYLIIIEIKIVSIMLIVVHSVFKEYIVKERLQNFIKQIKVFNRFQIKNIKISYSALIPYFIT